MRMYGSVRGAVSNGRPYRDSQPMNDYSAVSRLPALPHSEVRSVLAHFRHTSEDIQELPRLSDRRESL
jgi:hypothetical protein